MVHTEFAERLLRTSKAPVGDGERSDRRNSKADGELGRERTHPKPPPASVAVPGASPRSSETDPGPFRQIEQSLKRLEHDEHTYDHHTLTWWPPLDVVSTYPLGGKPDGAGGPISQERSANSVWSILSSWGAESATSPWLNTHVS